MSEMSWTRSTPGALAIVCSVTMPAWMMRILSQFLLAPSGVSWASCKTKGFSSIGYSLSLDRDYPRMIGLRLAVLNLLWGVAQAQFEGIAAIDDERIARRSQALQGGNVGVEC